MIVEDPTLYTKIPYVVYYTLEEKLQALLRGETLYLRKFERTNNKDVLVRLDHKKHTVSKISFDMTESEMDPRYWTTYNVGLNDLSLFTAIKFEEGIPQYTHRFMVDDIVTYQTESGERKAGIVEEVYVYNEDHNFYAYRLSGEENLYLEEHLQECK